MADQGSPIIAKVIAAATELLTLPETDPKVVVLRQRIEELANQDLPAVIAYIKASDDLLSRPAAATKVVRITDQIVVKYGIGVTLQEAETMKFVAANSTAPIPKFLAAFSEEETSLTFIIMEFIPGRTINDFTVHELLFSLTIEEKHDIIRQLKTATDSLRAIPPPGYIGSHGRHPLNSAVFQEPNHDPAICGPFASEAEMNEGMLRRLALNHPGGGTYVRFIRQLVARTLHGHQTVFTHGNLQLNNIMLTRIDGGRDFGSGSSSAGSDSGVDGVSECRFKVCIIDWGGAGWFPEYWEFCAATFRGKYNSLWMNIVCRVLQKYHMEYLMMQAIMPATLY